MEIKLVPKVYKQVFFICWLKSFDFFMPSVSNLSYLLDKVEGFFCLKLKISITNEPIN